MLYGKILRSPYAHARIRRIDASRALAVPGVKAVVTGADMPPVKPGTIAPQGELEIDMYYLSKLILAQGKVLFHGHPVAAVAATSPEIAAYALGLIDVEYEPLEPVLDVEKAMEPTAPLLHDDLFTRSLGGVSEKPSNIALHLQMERGNVEEGFAQADVVLERTYRTQMVHQGYLEPEAETAWVQPDGRIIVWCNSQGMFAHRTQLSILFNIPPSRIKVIPTEVGGAFGGKIYVRVSPICLLLSQKTGRPVQIVLTREEVLRATGPGSPLVAHIKVGARRDGQITAIQAKFIYDSGAFPGGPVAGGVLSALAPYKTLHMRVDGYDVVTNKPRVAAYRAPGATASCFAMEALMDEVAEALGMDPIDFRLRNAVEEGDPMPNGLTWGRIGLKAMLERARRSPAWTEPLTGPYRGRGMALGFWRGGTNTSSCHITVNADGSVNVTVGSVDLSSTRTGIAQMVAECLGIPFEQVRIVVGDTDTVAHTDNSGGSRITYSMSAAVYQASQDLLGKMKVRAAGMLGVPPEQVEYRDGRFFVSDIPDKFKTFPEVCYASTRGGGALQGFGSNGRLKMAPAFSLHIADVEVDPETGKVRILRYTTFQDVGRAINPTLIEGQMQGGAVQGIGWALTEEYVFDEKGVLRNASLLDYRMPVALDLPMIDCEIIEVPASDGPFGVRGVGEAPIVPPAGALANAIYRATGVRFYRLPMSPERVFWALREAGRNGPRGQ
ncbi:Putative xanthine dehydrogenase molybdenum-binding subunit XdhA [bacterium HR23]|nr:Putative xanthine dehydrogenase molybdenum-binding subunit XdhA [bacterium HR23]